MNTCELLIIGGGPAGLCAALSALNAGSNVVIVERGARLGGQLVKQTHMFFGSKKQYASTRGIDIASMLIKKVEAFGDQVKILLNTTVIGMYEDGMLTLLHKEDEYMKIKPMAVVAATGAYEKTLAFKNNDLPGIYGAGAVQTLMNVYGVKPGNRVLMVGAGNIGLIVTYQLMQAGVKVVAILDAAPKIGGYLVHASKVARMGVPILTSHTVVEAKGEGCLKSAIVSELDEQFNIIPGTEKEYDIDTMCISVGLSPLNELLSMRGCEMRFIRELSGLVPCRTANYETSLKNLFVAGDIAGVEEASSAMVEGYLAGLCAAASIGHKRENFDELRGDFEAQLSALRNGPVGRHILKGIEKTIISEGKNV
ncbi:MAG: FAD-dependent oxidoreductase [Clostridia bacterium]